ncbi:LuxR C-terminal-related transcriptional regulator [Amycolatopsis sp. Poz14]|uniref:ATP-binding protein n=1 Tax=Amycolatopsis sp. Poz14 TaxID=1447705 RepID=UPI001EE7DBC5|nr:LuxR C-terminal-related transcriptional regulator [Amycolatopsis sp. Poz14]MCG3751981.1 AAA family ATPase [Amycolatopsis sp. Poz14]
MTPQPAKPEPALPAEVSSFVGRREELAVIRELFSSARLVTLTGIGGVGKTRLALRAAGEMRRAFPGGVCLVELASLTEPDLLPQAVLDALGVRERPKADAVVALERCVRDRRMLLVLDNCEHLVDAAAVLAGRLLRSAADLKILATSRHALRVAGEHLCPVTPLRVPDPEHPPETGAVLDYPAIALFQDRVTAIVPEFAITEDNQAAVVRLCQQLEGIPLAIELAAARLRVLTLPELADRLADRFLLLRQSARGVPERHQTLSALIGWSHDLCTPAEQLLWRRASVFAGGFAIDALEAVCSDDALPPPALLDTVAGLVDKSVLVREEHRAQVRFRMLETIREYGQARLAESGERPALARRHRDWFARLVDTATREWAGPRQVDWAVRLRLEHADIRLALEYSMARPGEVATGLRIAAQPWFWSATEHLDEARLWLDRGLAQLSEPSREHAWALANRAYIAAFRGDDAALHEMPERARAMALELRDLPALTLANHVIGFRRSLGHGDIRSAIPLFAEAIRQYAETGLAAQYRDAVVVELATTHALLHEFDRAKELADDLFARCRAEGERWNLSYAMWLRALISLLKKENPHRVAEQLLEVLRIKRVFRDTLGLALTLEVLAWATAAKGEAERAGVLLGGTDQIWRTIGSRHLRGKRAHYEALARASVGDSCYEAAFSRGSELGVDELLRYALPEPAASETPVPAANPLTRRERQVAVLVAEGMSNKQIADKLVIAPRTAEGHVEKILAKLGFTTRTQIASWFARHSDGDR